MSATLDAGKFQDYFDGAPLVGHCKEFSLQEKFLFKIFGSDTLYMRMLLIHKGLF